MLMNLGGAKLLNRGKRKIARFNVQTKLALFTSGILLTGGAISFFALSKGQNDSFRMITAVFNSVTARTAGFNTIDIGTLPLSATVMMMMLMFIGASPGSTGGGIKTTTAAVLLSSIIAIIRGQNRILIFKRRIPFLVLNRALVVFAVSAIVVFLTALLLSITETASFTEILFESVSAFATVGLSMGLTGELSQLGKVIIIITMLIGRIGILSLAFAITSGTEQQKARVEYPSESVMIG